MHSTTISVESLREIMSSPIIDTDAASEILRLSQMIINGNTHIPSSFAPMLCRLAGKASDDAYSQSVDSLGIDHPGGADPTQCAANIHGIIETGLDRGQVFWPGLSEHINALYRS